MDVTIRQQLEQCIAELRQGTLTEQSLRRILDHVDGSAAERQDLLYLQAGSTSLNADVIGMRIVQDGEVSDGPADPDAWPYQPVIDAIRDGWRIVKFPELALMLDEKRTYGLGCEFILER